ncbi:hypothetical protein C8A03DRAFT_33792 [Achaetomium macrosporum]|uniref:Uncharacterized protein n=1 Tax=Achaetomium macrosporum TaxID=79813 RepID=A0AAN7HAZ5_9PEZI|nr:hypothetical protein C8A03DRAFT_33792 [Achaetomium macrosporum]
MAAVEHVERNDIVVVAYPRIKGMSTSAQYEVIDLCEARGIAIGNPDSSHLIARRFMWQFGLGDTDPLSARLVMFSRHTLHQIRDMTTPSGHTRHWAVTASIQAEIEKRDPSSEPGLSFPATTAPSLHLAPFSSSPEEAELETALSDPTLLPPYYRPRGNSSSHSTPRVSGELSSAPWVSSRSQRRSTVLYRVRQPSDLGALLQETKERVFVLDSTHLVSKHGPNWAPVVPGIVAAPTVSECIKCKEHEADIARKMALIAQAVERIPKVKAERDGAGA